MVWNARESSGRGRDSNQNISRFEQNPTECSGLQKNITVLDTASQNVNITTVIHTEPGLENDYDHSWEAGEDGKTSMQSGYSSFATNVGGRRSSTASEGADDGERNHMVVPFCLAESSSTPCERIEALLSGLTHPPVTVATLQELDLHSIQSNVNLRIDICHDPDLYFQPISGQKGHTKKSEAKKYWSAIAAEFEIYQHNALSTRAPCSICRGRKSKPTLRFKPRLPDFFDNLRQIVQMLVPSRDHQEIENQLDTKLLMQQVRKGALDPTRLSSWLANLLTSHCAPMRDFIAAKFVAQVKEGVEKPDMDIFMLGLETLLTMLEAMKLDVANHQIRSFRYPLIEATIEFQRECFSRAIETQQIEIVSAQRWYRLQCFHHKDECNFQDKSEADQKFESFIHGLANLCHPYEGRIPVTLQYDHNRITRIQEDLQDHIQMNLCLAVFNQQVQELAGPRRNPAQMHEDLRNRIICLTEDDDGNGGAISDHLGAIGVEITRAAFSLRPLHTKQALTLNSFHFNRTIKLLYDVFQAEDEDQTVTKTFLSSLEARTMQFAQQFKTMSSLEISNAQKQWARSRAGRDIVLAEWDEMARKLAHIGVLHWNVWADLCYCIADDTEQDEEKLSAVQEPSILVDHCNEPETASGLRRLPSISSGLDNCDGGRKEHLKLGDERAAMQGKDNHVKHRVSMFGEYSDEFEGVPGHEIEVDLEPDPDIG